MNEINVEEFPIHIVIFLRNSLRMCNKFKWIEKLCLHPEQPTYVYKITFEFANSYVFVDFSLYLMQSWNWYIIFFANISKNF